MSTQTQSELRGHRCKVSLSPLSLSIWHTHTHTLSILCFSSYELAKLILIQIRACPQRAPSIHWLLLWGSSNSHYWASGGPRLPRLTDELCGDAGSSGGLGALGPLHRKKRGEERRRWGRGEGVGGWEWVLIECEIHWLNKTKLICSAADLLTLPHSISSNDVCCCRSRRVKVWDLSRFKHVHHYVAITCLSVQETWRK